MNAQSSSLHILVSLQNDIQKKQADLAAILDNVLRIRRIRFDQIQKNLFPISQQKVFPEFGTPPDDTVSLSGLCIKEGVVPW